MYDYKDIKMIFGRFGPIIKEETVNKDTSYFVISPFSIKDGRKVYTRISLLKDKYDNRIVYINSALFMKRITPALNPFLKEVNDNAKGGTYIVSPSNVLEATKYVILSERTKVEEITHPWFDQLTNLQGAVIKAGV